MKILRKMRIRQRLLLSYLFVSIIPIIILGSFAVIQTRNTLLERSVDQIQGSLNGAIGSLDSRINNLKASVNVLAYTPTMFDIFNTAYTSYYDIYEVINQYVSPLFQTVKGANNDINALAIYTDNPISKSRGTIEDLSQIKNLPWFEGYGDSMEMQMLLDNGSLYLVRPLIGQYRSVYTNLVVLRVSFKQLFQGFDSLVGKEGYYGVYSQGELIFSNDEDDRIMPQKLDEAYLSLRKDGQYKTVGADLIVGGTTESAPFFILVSTPQTEIYNSTGYIVLVTVLLVVGCFLLLLFITWLFSSAMAKRIHNLHANVAKVEQGNVCVKLMLVF